MYLFPTERNREMWKYVLYARSAMKTKEKKFSKTLNVMQKMHAERLEALAARAAAQGETIKALVEARRTAA